MNNLLKIMCISVMLSSVAFGERLTTDQIVSDCEDYDEHCDLDWRSKKYKRCNQLLEKLEGEYGFTDRLLDQVRRYMPDTVKRPSSKHVQQFSPKSEENAKKVSDVKPNLRQKLKAIRKKIKGMILRQRPENKLVSIRYFKKEEPTQRVTKSLKASQINKVPLKSCLKTSKPTTKSSEPVARKKVSFSAEGPKSKENHGNTPHGP